MKNKIIFISLIFVLSILLACAALIDSRIGTNGLIDILVKITIIVVLLFYAKSRNDLKDLLKWKISYKYLLIALIPMIFSITINACRLDIVPKAKEVIICFFGVLTTAIWEELYFRYVGKTLFEKYTIKNVLFLAVAFALSHLINIFFYNPLSVLIQMVIAFGFAIFATALYSQTSIQTVIISHFLMNFSVQIINWCSSETSKANRLLGNYSYILIIVEIITTILIGIIILKKYICKFKYYINEKWNG